MNTEENTIAAMPDLRHLNAEELTAYSYVQNLDNDEALSSYFAANSISELSDPKLAQAVAVLFPNLRSYTEISEYKTSELLQIIEARNFGAHEYTHPNISSSALEDLVQYQKSLIEVPGAEQEGSIEPILESDSALSALTKNTENRQLLNGLYVEREPNIFYRLDSDKPALIDQGMKLKVINKDLETFKAAIELAEAKGWVGIQVNGSDKFKAEAWYQASIKGLTVRGYEPNEEDKKRLLEYQLESKTELTPEDKEIVAASYQSAQDYALERNAGVIYPNQSNENRNFAGRVVKVFDSHVVQDIGRNTMAVHEISRVGDIEPGTKLNIQYNGRSASVKEVQQKTSSLER